MSVGVEEFDYQHRQIFNVIGELNKIADSESETNAEVIDNILERLVDYSELHLMFEEEMFETYGYNDTKRHRELHDAYRNQIQRLFDDKDDRDILPDLMQFLARWWSNHILKEDKKYINFFRDKDVH